MGGRYYLSGVQLGILKAFVKIQEESSTKDLAQEVLQKVNEEQFVGNIEIGEEGEKEVKLVKKRN